MAQVNAVIQKFQFFNKESEQNNLELKILESILKKKGGKILTTGVQHSDVAT